MSKETDDLFDDEVTTGATLDSGTTVGGNQVYHLVNDGAGSGLDAETVDGSEPVQKGQKYTTSVSSVITKPDGSVEKQLTSPCRSSRGMDFNSDDSIWNADDTYQSQSMYKVDLSGTVQTKFTLPFGNEVRGVGVDSNDSIWHTDVTESSVYQFTESGSTNTTFSTPSSNSEGIGVDNGDSLWITSTNASSIYKTNQVGTIQSQYSSPSGQPKGISVDSDGSIWNSDASFDSESMYSLNQSASIILKFPLPDDDPYGVGVDSNDSIWLSDRNGGFYKFASINESLYSINKL